MRCTVAYPTVKVLSYCRTRRNHSTHVTTASRVTPLPAQVTKYQYVPIRTRTIRTAQGPPKKLVIFISCLNSDCYKNRPRPYDRFRFSTDRLALMTAGNTYFYKRVFINTFFDSRDYRQHDLYLRKC